MNEDSKNHENSKKSKKSSSSKDRKSKHSSIKRKAKAAIKQEHENKVKESFPAVSPEEKKTYTVYEENDLLIVELNSPSKPESHPKTVPELPAKKSNTKKKPNKREKPEPSASIDITSNKSAIAGKSEAQHNTNNGMSELEKKQAVLAQLKRNRQEYLDDLSRLREQIGKKCPMLIEETHKTHWDYLLEEMEWMAKDFDRERKSKSGNARKLVRANAKFLSEKQVIAERYEKQKKLEVRRNATNISKMIQQYWKSIDKIIKHNYYVKYEQKKQIAREKRLKDFVSKHLKLSEKVAEELKSKTGMYSYNSNQPQPAPEAEVLITLEKNDNGYTVVENNGESKEVNEEKYDIRAIAEKASEIAKSAQPTGFTLSTSKVTIKVPFLLKHKLREYQIIGLDWLSTLHDRRLNGILADEMGLGKTIQTISLLASLAVEKGIWGPHLIVVPTTIIINWEMEFKKWCPAFKVLTYFGSQRERKQKRTGWSRANAFHICITSYKLVIQDHFAFRRKKWYYMVLDEAQNIKNFRSQRWQLLLRFNTKRRLLLTGTPLQNDVMELWSLMHFLMPQIFASHEDFKEWFYNPFAQSINSNVALNLVVVQNLQSILRPFLLRRLKKDVEKQLPEKVEHIVYCNLSRRQRFLYDEYINCEKTQKTLQNSKSFN